MKLLILIICISISLISDAETISRPKGEIFPEEQEWFPTMMSRMGPGLSFQGDFYADLTKAEPYEGGFIVPYFIYTYAGWYVQYNTPRIYLKFDCSFNSIESTYYNYQDNFFAKQFDVDPTAAAAGPVIAICGVNSEEGKIYLAFADAWGGIETQSFRYIGWIPSKMKISYDNPKVIDIPMYSFNWNKKKGDAHDVLSSSLAKVNCDSKTISWKGVTADPKSSNNLFFKTTGPINLNARYMYLINKSCEIMGLQKKEEAAAEPIKKSSRNTMLEAKKKCATLGFKTGTEKFGNCVLELTK